MLTLLPVLEVLFWKQELLTKPTYTGIGDIKQFGTDYMYYQISTLTKTIAFKLRYCLSF
jgi:subfamily B ATP-binding cassette protein MsbA